MAFAEDQDVIQTVAPERSDQALSIGVLPGRPRRDRTIANPVGSKNSSEVPSPFMLPLDGNNARVRPVARGIEQARRSECSYPEGTAGHCPSLDDSARHGNVRHIPSARAAGSARQRGSPWTSTPPSPT